MISIPNIIIVNPLKHSIKLFSLLHYIICKRGNWLKSKRFTLFWLPLMKQTSLTFQTGKLCFQWVFFRKQNLVVTWGSSSEQQSQTSLQLCSPDGGGEGNRLHLVLKKIPGSAWGCPDHNCHCIIWKPSPRCLYQPQPKAPLYLSVHISEIRISPSSLQHTVVL